MTYENYMLYKQLDEKSKNDPILNILTRAEFINRLNKIINKKPQTIVFFSTLILSFSIFVTNSFMESNEFVYRINSSPPLYNITCRDF